MCQLASLVNQHGKPVQLGPEIGRGGEGTVYQVQDDVNCVAKVYNQPANRAIEAKLTALVNLASPELLRVAALPTSLLYENNRCVGLLMPLVSLANFHPIHNLYSPAQRRKSFPTATWENLFRTARNCAAAFERLHNAGIVVGDVNHSNLLVAENADVRLIDCDSFQVRVAGRTIRCPVGVPEYTPPELQGNRFDQFDREPNHDNFGLAVLLFQLLFMGRHPFAGVYTGSGDMPLERAIREHRFAYGRSAHARLMQPPPHTLPLEAVTPRLAELFTRAFSAEGARGNRPTAKDWKTAFDATMAFQTCSSDAGHVYLRAISACPWCELMRQGCRNLFLGVTLHQPTAIEPPTSEVEEIWQRIASYALPSRTFQVPSVPRPLPTPLPEGVPSHRPKLELVPLSPAHWAKIAALVVVVVLVVVDVFWSSVFPILLFSLMIASVVAGLVLWKWREHRVEANHRYENELENRRKKLANVKNQLIAVQSDFNQQSNEFKTQLDQLKNQLGEVHQTYNSLPDQHHQERVELERQAWQMQLEEFLREMLLADANIEQIGPTRKASLASFGIETAADLTEQNINRVPGFGPRLVERLLQWRESRAREFRFDPNRGVPISTLQELARRYKLLRQDAADRLRRGDIELANLVNGANNYLNSLSRNVLRLAYELAQAQADLDLMS